MVLLLCRILLGGDDPPSIFQYLFSHSGGPISTVDVYTTSFLAQFVQAGKKTEITKKKLGSWLSKKLNLCR